MSAPTVAEIIGMDVHNPHRHPHTDTADGGRDVEAWKCAECGEWISTRETPEERTQCPSPWNQHPKPTVDDMLAWLGSQGIQASMSYDPESINLKTNVRLVRQLPLPGRPGETMPDRLAYESAPTLHAALVAAVETVASS